MNRQYIYFPQITLSNNYGIIPYRILYLDEPNFFNYPSEMDEIYVIDLFSIFLT